MPLYTYACTDHGEFSAWGQMSTSDRPEPCPTCHEPAPRALARPAISGRSGDDPMAACGMGGCGEAMGGGDGPMSGGCGCAAGGCVH